MPPKRKAVQDGSTPQRSLRPRRACTAPVAEPSDVVKPAKTMSRSAESSKSRPKRNPARSAKKDPWAEEHLLTSPNSRLIDVDLVKLLAKPEAWTCLDEDEKKEILSLLPEHVHPNPDPDPEDPDAKIPPLPEEFLRYSNNWRDGVRQFQVDLQNGRYDPEWLRQAAEAMEERARGEFDDFKEREFEEFWGQKQKLDYHVIAGESSKVKLDTLIKHGVVKKGDIWKYARVFGKQGRIMVEKETKIVDVVDSTLTFAIPAGQRVFLATMDDNTLSKDPPKDEGTSDTKPESHPASKMDTGPNAAGESPVAAEVNGTTESVSPMDTNPDTRDRKEPKPKLEEEPQTDVTPESKEDDDDKDNDSDSGLSSVPTDISTLGCDSITVEITNPAATKATTPPAVDTAANAPSEPALEPKNEPDAQTKVEEALPGPGQEPSPMSTGSTLGTEQTKDIIFPNVSGPGSLETKILQIDGRIKSPPNGNAWKQFRCYRNNQDMGSLWEVRQAWFVRMK